MKTAKKALSLFLTVLLAAAFVPLFAVGSSAAGLCTDGSCGQPPVILVTGAFSSTVYKTDDTGRKQVFFNDLTHYTSMLTAKLPELQNEALTLNVSGLRASALSLADDMFGDVKMDNNGDTQPGVKADAVWPVVNGHYKNSFILYRYDWRADPIATAADFAAFIDYVCRQTGHDKVRILSCSYGGIITMTYMKYYGVSKIDEAVFDVATVYGSELISEAFAGHYDLDSTSLRRFSSIYFDNDELNTSLDVLDKAGVLDTLLLLLTSAAKNTGAADDIMPELALHSFATMPSMWALVTDKYYNEAKNFIFKDQTDEYAGLISKIDRYHSEVAVNAKQILSDAAADGVYIATFTKYDWTTCPGLEGSDLLSDGMLTASETSLGATAAKTDSTLGAGYKQKNTVCGHDHLSADGMLDASTCLFPETAWFVKGLNHTYGESVYCDIFGFVLFAEEAPTVRTSEKYPQFMQYDKAGNTLVPVSETYADAGESTEPLSSSFPRFISYLIKRIVALFTELWQRLSVLTGKKS